ncbi:hypothetical protein Tco_0042738, partial [Tanacetum coccineum]
DPDPDLRILRFYVTAKQKRSGSSVGSLQAKGISLFFANSAPMGNGDDVFLGDAPIIVLRE